MDLDGGGGAGDLVEDGVSTGMGGCMFPFPGGGGGGPCLDGGLGDPPGGRLGSGLVPDPDGGCGSGRELSDGDGLFAIGGGAGGAKFGAFPGGVGRGLELLLGGWGKEVLELFGEGGLKPGGFIAGPLAPPVPSLLLSPADLSLGIPPAKRPPRPPEGAPIELPPPPLLLPLPELDLPAATCGALRSFVSTFFNFAPL